MPYLSTGCTLSESSISSPFYQDNWHDFLHSSTVMYSSVPNRPVGWNNHVGGIFHGKLINM